MRRALQRSLAVHLLFPCAKWGVTTSLDAPESAELDAYIRTPLGFGKSAENGVFKNAKVSRPKKREKVDPPTLIPDFLSMSILNHFRVNQNVRR